MLCLLKIISLLVATKSAENLKLLWFETWHTSFSRFYFWLTPQSVLKFLLRFFFLKWKLINVLTMFRFFALFFIFFYFWGHYSQATKSSFLSSDSSLYTLRVLFLWLSSWSSVFSATNKSQTWMACFPCCFFSTLFHRKF